MKSIFNLSLVCLLLCTSAKLAGAQTVTQAPTASHLLAAEQYLEATGINTQLSTIVDNMIDQYANSVPADKKDLFISVMKKFMSKYYSWESLKSPMSALYAQEFTEPELKQFSVFFNTPAGKKLGQKQALLTQKGMLIGQQLVQEHQTELQQMIQDAVK